jgi:hypothetical protein
MTVLASTLPIDNGNDNDDDGDDDDDDDGDDDYNGGSKT